MQKNIASLFISLLFIFPSFGQVSSPKISSPAEFLGYELGDNFTPHHRVVDYYEALAAASDQVTIEVYGYTYENRPLLNVIIASKENMARIDEIRLDNRRRAGLEDGEITGDPVGIVYLSYNVHGNESVSTEASMKTAYQLLQSSSEKWLENTVVILDPCINPDGRERYVSWYNQMVGRWGNVNPLAREHSEPWPAGRVNHYYTDLNRDWAWQMQIESQQRIKAYQKWLPQIHVDFHEQGVDAPYYFAPAVEPLHEAITSWQRELEIMIGQNHAKHFDQENWLYFTKESFDLLYPSYGDTWPAFHGAVGMTYEQGGSGRAGLGIETSVGDTLKLSDRIAHHYTTGLSTVEVAAREHNKMIAGFAKYYDDAQNRPAGEYKTYIIRHTSDDLDELRQYLDDQEIEYGRAPAIAQRGFNFTTRKVEDVRLSSDDILISSYQPNSNLVRVLFEPETAMSDSLTYDNTAWALPYANGYDAFAFRDKISSAGGFESTTESNNVSQNVDKPYAYLLEWNSFQDAKTAASLMRNGINIRYAEKAFSAGGRDWNPGTIIILRKDNEFNKSFDNDVTGNVGNAAFAVSSGWVSNGHDFGSSSIHYMHSPKVAIISGESTSSYAVGEVWHYFDQQLEYPITLIDSDDFDTDDLSKFDVLILANGYYRDLLDESTRSEIRSWVRAGGRLIAMEGAARFLAGKEGFGLKDKEIESIENNPYRRYVDREKEGIADYVPGAIFRVKLDNSHPLAFGYSDTYFTLRRRSSGFEFMDKGWNVGRLEEDAHITGFAGHVAMDRIEEQLIFGVEEIGNGAIVYMADDPLFRHMWHAGRLLFANAVFFVGVD